MAKIIKTKSVLDTNNFALSYATSLKPLDIICLIGDLGVGKTVIAKQIGKYFNIKDDIISPTFNIVKSYEISNNEYIKILNHFDLYRIKDISELYNIGFEEYIYNKNAITLIEWPEVALTILPKNIKVIRIKRISENEREIEYDE